ncbi:MAG: hypothetical protein L0Y74_09885 [candidate division Zixibacteria bacterium]|nr:hypothetical protein [candidate division Zixibacteria bacterium]
MFRITPAIIATLIGFCPAKLFPQTVNQPVPIQISTRISDSSLIWGDTLVYTVRISWNGAGDLYLIEPLQLSNLENLKVVGESMHTGSGGQPSPAEAFREFHYRLTADTIGEAHIGEQEINYYNTRTDQATSYRSQAYVLQIKPASRPGRFIGFLFAIGALLVAGYAIRFHSKMRNRQPGLKLTLEEQFKNQLAAISRNENPGFYRQARKIITEYWGQKAGLNLSGKTTTEIKGSLGELDSIQKEQVGQILDECDRAIYGSQNRLSRQEIMTLLYGQLEPYQT